jgi:hypothetical protein
MGKSTGAISSGMHARGYAVRGATGWDQTWCRCRATAASKAAVVAGVAVVLGVPLAGVALGPWIVDVAAESSWERRSRTLQHSETGRADEKPFGVGRPWAQAVWD